MGIVLLRNSRHERRRLEIGFFFCLVDALDERFAVDVQKAAEVQRVERMQGVAFHGLLWDDHEVVNSLVEHKKLAVAVKNLASGGILGHKSQGVVVGQLFVMLVEYLQGKQPDKIYHADSDEYPHHQ